MSSLRIKQLEPTDTGFYACVALANSTKIMSEGVLTVGAKWGTGTHFDARFYQHVFDVFVVCCRIDVQRELALLQTPLR